MATFPRTTTSGGTGTTAPTDGEELTITAAGTYAVTALKTHVVISPNLALAAAVAFTLPADYPLNRAVTFVDARPGTEASPSEFSVTPSGTGAGANVVGDATFSLVNDQGGWASIVMRRSSLGWSLS